MGCSTTYPYPEDAARKILNSIVYDEGVFVETSSTTLPGRIYSTSSATRWPSSPDPKGNRKERRTAAAKARRRKKHK